MNGIVLVREEFKQAARQFIRHINMKEYPKSIDFFMGRMFGLDIALRCLGINSDKIREMYNTCKEEVQNEADEIMHAEVVKELEEAPTKCPTCGRDLEADYERERLALVCAWHGVVWEAK